ncbi:MAG TPA: hypothetical protein VI855_05280, partial [Dehalococcoidia bacterium]|nr:hypothetical protein [Dehalococcoidia bacterium]
VHHGCHSHQRPRRHHRSSSYRYGADRHHRSSSYHRTYRHCCAYGHQAARRNGHTTSNDPAGGRQGRATYRP